MSYILEALKKAERQRRLGAVPDVYTPSITDAAPLGSHTRANRLRWMAVAAAMLLAAGGLIWLRPWHVPEREPQSKPPASAEQPSTASGNAAQSAQRSELVAPVATATRPAAEPVPVEKQNMPAVPAAPQAEEEAIAAVKPPRKTRKAKKAHTAQAERGAAAKRQASTSVEEARAEPPLPTQHELPDQLRQQIPAMAVNGSIYANNPADRTLVINNQVLHEGEQLMPGLTLERIKAKEAIMNNKGFRYRLLY